MNAVERVKRLCKEREIAVSRLEEDLGFGNAYIRGLKKGTFPDDRLRMIADYFGVSVNYLMNGDIQNSESFPEQAELFVKIRNDKRMLDSLEKFYKLSDNQRNHVLELIDLLWEVAE